MTFREIVLFVIDLALLVVASVYVRKHWRGETLKNDLRVAGYWFSSPRFRRGHVRATLIVIFNGFMIGTLALMFLLLPADPHGVQKAMLEVTLAATLLGMVVSAGLYWMIVLFNQPKFLVAPHLRHELGALADRKHEAR